MKNETPLSHKMVFDYIFKARIMENGRQESTDKEYIIKNIILNLYRNKP